MTDIPHRTSVLVVGGGPVGMTLALTLHRGGVVPLVLDAKAAPREHSQAATIWPRTLEILDLLGIVDHWTAVASPWRSFTVRIGDDVTHIDFPHSGGAHPYPYLVGQDKSEAILDAALKALGIPVCRGVKVTGMQIDADGATVTYVTSDGSIGNVRATYVVGCDGSSSFVREAAGIARQGARDAGVQIVQADAFVNGSLTLEADRAYVWTGRDATSLLLFRIDTEGRYRIFATLPDDGRHDMPALSEIETIARTYIPEVYLSGALWITRYRTQHLNAVRYRNGRIFLAGDSAHVWIPTGGQGMNLGMHDAFNLGWKLARAVRGESGDGILDTYEAERRPVASREVVEAVRDFSAFAHVHSLGDRALRAIAPFALRCHPLTDRYTTHLDELDTRYGPGILVRDDGGSGAIPGMRAPDAAVNSAGRTIRLFDLLRPGRFVVLAWIADAARIGERWMQEFRGLTARYDVDAYVIATAASPCGPNVRPLVDLPQTARHRFQVRSDTISVIRPDGVVGLRTSPERLDTIEGFFAAIVAEERTVAPAP